jgi:photosystem II stability/assembly factor-like uncharacterized protein
MSLTKSKIPSGDYTISLTGVEGISTKYNSVISKSELYYTNNSGATWIISNNINTSPKGLVISLSSTGTPGSYQGIAAGFDVNNYPIIYYTTNSGVNWSPSILGLSGLETTEISNIFASISKLKAVIAVETAANSVLLYYSIDGGINWTQSTNDSAIPSPALFIVANSNIKNAVIALDGVTVRYIFTLINNTGVLDIYTSVNGGANVSNVLSLSNFTTYPTALSLSGSIALLGGDEYVYLSNNGGLNWSISINNGNLLFQSVSIDGANGLVAALNTDNSSCIIYYTNNSGTSWNTVLLSATNVSDIIEIVVSGTIGYIALKNVLYKTIDGGANWKISNNLDYIIINDISLSGNNVILGTDSGIYYNVCTSTFCYTYEGQRFTEILINYNSTLRYQYYRFIPDYFRRYFPECGFKNYREALMDTTIPLKQISICLRKQLQFGPIDLYSLEEIFIRIVPSINDSDELTTFKDNLRNEFFAFALNIEKSFLYFNIGRETCNNNLIPWDAVFNVSTVPGENFNTGTNFTYVYGKNIPITQYDQYIIYSLATSYFNSVFSVRNNTRLNYYNVIRLALGIPIVGELTVVNFYNMIYFSYVFLNQLFSISQTLLLGKDPGIPRQFLDLFFPYNRQKYYYNYYLSWLQSRNRYLGFGSKINESNGDGTYIRIPGS